MAGLKVTLDGVDTISGTRVTIVGEIGRTGFAPGHPLPEPPPEGEKPPGIWGGPIDPYPGHPLPEPPGKPPEPVAPPIDWKVIWHPTEGWVVVGVPNFPHPAPG